MTSYRVKEVNNILLLVSLSPIKLLNCEAIYPHRYGFVTTSTAYPGFKSKQINDTDAFSFSFFNIDPTSNLVIYTTSFSVALYWSPTSSGWVVNFVGVTPWIITGSAIGICSLAFTWKFVKSCRICYCICCINTRAGKNFSRTSIGLCDCKLIWLLYVWKPQLQHPLLHDLYFLSA